jgi:hypothetical protein
MNHRIEFEAEAGILAVRLTGFLDDTASRRFADDLAVAIKAIRVSGQPLLFLVDNSEGRVASPPVAQALAERLRTEYRPGDRTAIIVASSLNKLQARRFSGSANEVFMSEKAARTWLTAYVGTRIVAA